MVIMDGVLMRASEAACLVGAALMLNASLAVRGGISAIAAAALILELKTTKYDSHPFRPNSGRGICIGLSILPLVFASQLAIIGPSEGSSIAFLFRLSLSSAIILFIQLLRKSDYHLSHDKITIAAMVVVAALTFSYADFLRGVTLVFLHLTFARSLVFSLPFTFTFGEAYVIAFFLVLVLYNGIANVLSSALFFLPAWCSLRPIIVLNEPWVFLSQYVLLALAMIVFAQSSLVMELRSLKKDIDERIVGEFWARFLIIGAAAEIGLLFSLDNEPVSFVVKSIFEQPPRFKLCLGWVISIAFSLVLFKKIESWSKCRIIISRKLYHFLITIIVVPGILIDAQFLALAFVVAFCVFVVGELIRISRISKFSTMLQQYMADYVNGSEEPALAGRDCGSAILAHIYLLIGCALPVWLNMPFLVVDHPVSLLPAFAGAIALGICDSVAAFVGVRFGTCRWPGSNRTIQGSFAAFASALVCLGLLNILVCNNSIAVRSFILPALGLSIMEASLDQIDNLFLPLFFYSSLNTIS